MLNWSKKNQTTLEEIVKTTMRNRIGMGKSFNSGAFQRIVKDPIPTDPESAINCLERRIRIEEIRPKLNYWGA